MIIIGLSAMNGFQRELNNRVLSVIPHGEFAGVRGPIQNWQPVLKQVKESPKIIAAAPYVGFTALAEKDLKLKAIAVRGIEPLKSLLYLICRNILSRVLGKTLRLASTR